MKKRLFFDMDNVLVDFESGLQQIEESVKAQYVDENGKPHYDDIPGIFSKMRPVEGAEEAVKELAKVYDVFILSTAPWNNSSAWSDKVEWVKKYFGDDDMNPLYKRMIITHRKDLVEGDYLIDDRGKNGTSEFKGEWIQFGSDRFPDWNTVQDYLLNKNNKTKPTFRKLLDNRNIYSWTALVLLVLFEGFAFGGIHCGWCIWGPWTLLSSLLVVIVGIVGRVLNHKFNLRSVILTKLLANAIAPQRLGTIYLLLFVVHIGWLTNAAMLLFMPGDITNVRNAVLICIAGLITLICFFPNGRKLKDSNPQKVFISGISAINPYNLNLTPLVRILQLTEDTDNSCELFILFSDYYLTKDNKEQEKILGNFRKYYEQELGKLPKVYLTDFDKVELDKLDCIKENIKSLIKMVAINMFPEKTWIPQGLKITFSEQAADYNQFNRCFEIVEKFVKGKDDKSNVLFFNLTPGTGIVGSLMTLMAIDGNRSLYYYSQDNSMKETEKLKEVDKSQVPLYSLLSQALDTLEDYNR